MMPTGMVPSPPVSKKRTKGGVYTSDITFEALSSVFHMPCTKACAHLGMGLTIFKRLCRKHGLYQWPYRALKKQVAVSGQLEQAAMLRIVAACRQPPLAPQQAAAAAQAEDLWRDDSSSSGGMDMQGVVVAGLEDSDDAASPRTQLTALGQQVQASPQQSQLAPSVVPSSPAGTAGTASVVGGQLGLLLSAMEGASEAKDAQQQPQQPQQQPQQPQFKMPAPIRTAVPRSALAQTPQRAAAAPTPPPLPVTPVCPAARRADKRSAELLHRRLLASSFEQLLQSPAITPAQVALQQAQAQAQERAPGLPGDFFGLLMQLNQMAGSLDMQVRAATAAAAMHAQLQQPAAGPSPLAAPVASPSFAETLTRMHSLQQHQVPAGSPLASAARYHFTPTASPPSVSSRTQLPAAWLAFQSPFAMQQLQQAQAQAQAQARALLSGGSGSLSLAPLQGSGSTGSMCPPSLTAAQQLQMQTLMQGYLISNMGVGSLAPQLSVPLHSPLGAPTAAAMK